MRPDPFGLPLFDFVSNNPVSFFDLLGLRMPGHHIVPEAVWRTIFGNSQRVSNIWGAVMDTADAVIDVVPGGGHNFTAHDEYNRRVAQAILDYLGRTEKRPSCINQKIARRILKLIKKIDDPYIRGFNEAAAFGIDAVKAWNLAEGRAILEAEQDMVRLARAASGAAAKESAFVRYARRGRKVVKVIAIGSFVYLASQEGLQAATEQTLKDLVFYDEFMGAGGSLVARGLDAFYWTSAEKRFRDAGFSDEENPFIDTSFPEDVSTVDDQICCEETEDGKIE